MAKKKSKSGQASKTPTRNSYIAKAPIRRLMKNEGAGLVAEEAVELLIQKLTEAAIDITKKAVKIVKEDKRKRVTASDIIAAERL